MTHEVIDKRTRDRAHYQGRRMAEGAYTGRPIRRWDAGNAWRVFRGRRQLPVFRAVFGVSHGGRAVRREVGQWFRKGFRDGWAELERNRANCFGGPFG